jgi:hypothetical protein
MTVTDISVQDGVRPRVVCLDWHVGGSENKPLDIVHALHMSDRGAKVRVVEPELRFMLYT